MENSKPDSTDRKSFSIGGEVVTDAEVSPFCMWNGLQCSDGVISSSLDKKNLPLSTLDTKCAAENEAAKDGI